MLIDKESCGEDTGDHVNKLSGPSCFTSIHFGLNSSASGTHGITSSNLPTFKVMFESRASLSLTNNKKEMVGPMHSVGSNAVLSGIVKGAIIKGQGIIMWEVKDVNGNPEKDQNTRLSGAQG